MKQKKHFFWLGLTSLSFVPLMTIVACANNSSSNENQPPQNGNDGSLNPDTNFQTAVDQWFENGQLNLNFQAPVITEALFLQYQNQPEELAKAFVLENQTKEELNFKIVKAELNEQITLTIQIFNKKGQQAQKILNLNKNRFTADQQNYVNQVYQTIGKNLRLKPEFANQKLSDLLTNVKSHQALVDLFVKDQFLGIQIEYLIPSQTINFDQGNGLNVNYILKDNQNQNLTPTQGLGPKFVQLESEQITPLTLLFENDLNKNDASLSNLGDYFGQTLLLTNNSNSQLSLNDSFTNKHITGKLDFSSFSTINFNSGANFSSNDITTLIFAPETTINNLSSGLFTNNKLTSVNLPSKLNAFNVGAFDANVTILGLEKLSFIKHFYDPTTKNLFLNKLTQASDVTEVFNYLNKINGNQPISLNKVYLPKFQFDYNQNINVNEIIFNSAIVNDNTKLTTETFNSNISNWTITQPITIPKSVLLIDKGVLPTTATISRQFHEQILGLINNNTLDLSQQINLLSDTNNPFYLFNNLDKLDQLFWGFTSVESTKINTLQTILIKQPTLTGNSILNLNDQFRNGIEFFKNNGANNKQIKIDAQFNKINYNNFYQLKNDLKAKQISLIREKPASFNFLDTTNHQLNLDQLYANSLTNNVNDLYQYLLGFEEQIQSITKSTTTEIKPYTFYQMQFSQPVTLDLSNVTKIGNYAFASTQNLNFSWPNQAVLAEIGDYAFYQSNLNLSDSNILSKARMIGSYAFAYNSLTLNELNLAQATTIGASAFYNVNGIKKIILSNNISRIENSAFYNAGLKELNLPQSVNFIDSFAFANNTITASELDLSYVNTINSYAFNNTTKIAKVKFSQNINQIGDSAFYNAGLTSLTLPATLTNIGANAFANNQIVTTELDLSHVTTIGNGAFNGAGSIDKVRFATNLTEIQASAFNNAGLKELNLPQSLRTIGNNAFANNNALTTVQNLNLENINLVDVFGFNALTTINFNPPADLQTQLGYNETTKILDLSQQTSENTKLFNLLRLLLKDKRDFAEIILPNMTTISQSLIDLLTTNTTINKLTWNATGRTMTFSLSGKTNIKSLANNFVQGMSSIPDNAFFGMNMSAMNNVVFSLNSITKVGASAFQNSGIKKFSDTTNLKEIASRAFDYDTTLDLGVDVKLQDDAFSAQSNQTKLPTTVSRNQIFSNQNAGLMQIYDPITKILDFTKADVNDKKFFSKNDWNKYLNIGQYLVDGDVQEIILPNIYVIWDGFVDNLGTVQQITFQHANQQIYAGAFSRTTVQNKPDKSQTNIIVDGDNFFS